MALLERKIDLTFLYGKGENGLTEPKKTVVSGLRVLATIDVSGGAGLNKADIKVYGMTPSLMNDLSTVGQWMLRFRKNTIIINAGDDEIGMPQVFSGQITMAYADLVDAPNTVFTITASTGVLEAVMPLKPTNPTVDQDVAVLIKSVVDKMNIASNANPPWVFENNGVNKTLRTPIYEGDGRSQIAKMVHDAEIEWNSMENNVVSIWNKGDRRKSSGKIPIISADTGMVSYPTFTATGVIVKTLFNPDIRFGDEVDVFSSSPTTDMANGRWRVVKLLHELESQAPTGKWFTQIVTSTIGAFK